MWLSVHSQAVFWNKSAVVRAKPVLHQQTVSEATEEWHDQGKS